MGWQIGAFQRSTAGCRWLGHLAIEPRAAQAVDRDADPIDPVEAGPPVHASTVVPDPGPAPLRFHGKHLVEVHVAGHPHQDDVVGLDALGVDRRDHDGGPDGMSGRIEGRPAGTSPSRRLRAARRGHRGS